MKLVHETGATVLCPDYRRPPEHPWPTPVKDCLETYRWLLNQGHVDPRKIVFAGDSAGGGLVLAVLSEARAAGLPMPRGGVLWSPWVDLSDSISGSWTTNQRTDFLPRDLAAKIALGYAGIHTLAAASPGNVDLTGFPPLLIEVGDCECLHDQVVRFAGRASAFGINVELHVAPGMVHVFPLFAAFAKADAEPVQAFKRFARFTDRVMDGNWEHGSHRERLRPGEAKSK
jgi:acetyl esterase/lipase